MLQIPTEYSSTPKEGRRATSTRNSSRAIVGD